MRFKNYRRYIILTACILFSYLVGGQTYSFKNYGTESNIPNTFIYTIEQDNNGYLWVGTGGGLAKFDGFRFYPVIFPDSVSQPYPTASLKDSDGTLWFGCNDGNVFYTRGKLLEKVELENKREISEILEGPDGYIYIISQGESINRINRTDPNEKTNFFIDRNLVLFSACFTQSGNILLGTQENLQLYEIEGESLTLISKIDEFDYYSITDIFKIGNSDIYLMGTNGNGLFRFEISGSRNTLSRITASNSDLDYLSIQSVIEDDDGYLWVATNESGIVRMLLSDDSRRIESAVFFDKTSGLAGTNVRKVFQDTEGNYWFGLFGDGLSLLNSYAFSFYSPGITPETNNIIYVTGHGDDYFLGTSAGYYIYDLKNSRIISFTDMMHKTGRNEIVSYCVDKQGNIWMGTNGEGLFVSSRGGVTRQFYRSGDSGEDYIRDILVDDRYIWLGTLNGVILLDKNTGRIKSTFDINNGLPHNSINHLIILKDRKVAVATKSDRLYLIDPETGVSSNDIILFGTTANEISSFCQTDDGNIWMATKGNGVFEFIGDSVNSFSRSDMLMSDYCYSILDDSENRIWIGHERGFSRYNRNTGTMRTYGTEFARDGICNTGGMYESPDGMVLIGTTQGLIIYNRPRDKRQNTIPQNNINSVTINDVVYPVRSSFTLPYSKRYNIRINYVGINFSDPEKVYYQTFLENFDDDWSAPTTDREVRYTLSSGKYHFRLISMNESGLTQDEPFTFDILIKQPFWRTWWFILSSLILTIGIVTLIIKEREKAQKKIQTYLEEELEVRTSVVVKQKAEIELQNIEITDSINYAKRIQTSILPDFNRLKESFNDAFIFFRPRDIVSGDFYWFDKLDDERIILVCADSTGHGVPGAFMSMIGSTLLQDIVSRQRISKPSEILMLLDNQIFTTLNRNLELGVSNDGMDLVVCEINPAKRHFRFASAMRPVIIVMDGESYYIKGNRCSVGGESVIEKYFDDQEYYLNEGDAVYMFSDGLPDQFGGTDGKKMKIARLKKIIEDVVDLPMDGQKEIITKFYDEWKGENDQVDDILLIGFKM